MSKLQALEAQYSRAKDTKDLGVQMDFLDALVSEKDDEVVAFHYQLLKGGMDERFFQFIRNSFKKRGTVAEGFLLRAIDAETDPSLQCEALQVLGSMGSSAATPIAVKFTQDARYDHQYRGIIVLGWIGGKGEIGVLTDALTNNSHALLRGYAASALRQMWFRNPKWSAAILRIYYDSLTTEKSDETNEITIACVQDLLKRKFGIKESRYGEISGDVSAAKPKAIKALKNKIG